MGQQAVGTPQCSWIRPRSSRHICCIVVPKIYFRFFLHFLGIGNRRFAIISAGSPHALEGVVQLFLLPLVNVPDDAHDIHDHYDDRRLILTTSPCLVTRDERLALGSITPSPRAPLQPPTTPSIPPIPNLNLNPNPNPNPNLYQHLIASSVRRDVYVECPRQRPPTAGRPMRAVPTNPGGVRWPIV